MQNKWAQIQSILAEQLDSGQVKAWIASLVPARGEKGLVLYAQTEFAAAHVRTWYGSHLAGAAARVFGQDCPVSVECRPGGFSPAASPGAKPGRDRSAVRPENWRAQPPAGQNPPLSPENASGPQEILAILEHTLAAPAVRENKTELPLPKPLPPARVQLALPGAFQAGPAVLEPEHAWRFSFEDFVVGPSNELAFMASRSMCGDVRQTDMLFLSSSTGLGKTHLIHATGMALSAACNRKRPQVAYLTAEEFTSRFFLSIKGKDTETFKARYRNLDLLLLEDVHLLQGKETMQSELLATLKALRDRGGKVVVSSSFAPRDLRQMDDQLHSRLSAGLLAFIERPNEETRREILRRKACQHRMLLPDDVEILLARHLCADVRQIESCLHNLILKARLQSSRITPQMALEVLGQYASHTPILDMDSIIDQICQGFHLTREQILSASRKQEYVFARNAAFYLARKHTDLSLENIGQRFNRRHSTVLKGITSLERELSRQTPLGTQIANTLNMIERNGNILCGTSAAIE